MNREQAKVALSEGKTLTHKYFTKDEWVKGVKSREGNWVIFEDGTRCTSREFWHFRQDEWADEDWEIIPDQIESEV